MVEVHEPFHRRNANWGRTAAVEGYTRSSYGDAFADVYDEWYTGISDAAVTAAVVAGLAGEIAGGRRGRVLELAVGTGRLALPLAATGLEVHGIDTSAAMLERLRARDPDGHVTAVLGDMVDDLPAGPFDVALLAYNSLFNLESAERQAACFAAVAARLAPGGTFVVEAFVPEDPPRVGTVVTVRSMTATEVVLSISDHDPAAQRAEGHLVQFVDGAKVRLRPWSVRYAAPPELDRMAASAGLSLRARWEDFERHPFGDGSPRHVSVYALSRDGTEA
jgi:SAM-dependent methyltransferase